LPQYDWAGKLKNILDSASLWQQRLMTGGSTANVTLQKQNVMAD
jgi:hypothetical protein